MQQNRKVCLLTLTIGLGLALSGQAQLKVGEAFPDLSTCKLEGDLSLVPKDKVVLIDFWASWCGPCVKSFPVMDELQKTYGPKGFAVVAVNEDDKKSDMEHFLKDHHVTFAVLRDAAQKLVEKAGISSMPSSFVIDKAGKIAFAHTGFHGIETKKEYAHEIESLLNQAEK